MRFHLTPLLIAVAVFAVLFLGVRLVLQQGGPATTHRVASYAPWQSKSRSPVWATLEGAVAKLHPSGVNFRVPPNGQIWVKRKDMDIREQMSALGDGQRFRDRPFVSVCNAMFPIDRCVAQLQSEYLLFRVYVLAEPIDSLEQRITRRAAGELNRFAVGSLERHDESGYLEFYCTGSGLTKSRAGQWQCFHIPYRMSSVRKEVFTSYDRCSASVNIHLGRVGKKTIVMVPRELEFVAD